nr:penicillin acylase family protein [Sinosporangium album]
MPRRVRWVARAVSVLVVLGLLFGGVAVWAVQRSFPQVEGALAVKGLSSEVTVYRDGTGIPHIYADTADDLFMAQGYVHAQDRFWEMDFRRHATAGRLSELFGSATLTEDKVIRTMGWRRVAEQELPLLDEVTRRYLDAYAKGVNAWLADNDGASLRGLEYVVLGVINSGYEPAPWTAVDSLAWLKAMAWDLRSNVEDEIGRALAAAKLPAERVGQLWPDYPFDRHDPIVTQGALDDGGFDQDAADPVDKNPARDNRKSRSAREVRASLRGAGSAVGGALARAADALRTVPSLIGAGRGDGIGSNSWVVGGRHTASGKPLLANDPHLSASMPSVWYQTGLHCRTESRECPFDVTGFTFAGVPGVMIGRNDRIAWGFTNLGPDVADLFLEKVKDNAYLYQDTWKPLTTRVEEIKIAGGAPVRLTVRETGNGPIMSDVHKGIGGALPGAAKAAGETAEAVSLRWTALQPSATADAIFALNAAKDWAEFRSAAALFAVPSQNLIYADVDGNIGYQAPGIIPIRAKGDGKWPAPGWTGEYEWTGSIPFAELPSVLNPPEGYIVTANNAVIDPARYGPVLTYDWSYGYRSQRILDRLNGAIKTGRLDVAAMSRIHQDTGNGLGPVLKPELMKVPLAGPSRDARELLRTWDYSQDADSAPAAYFNAVWRHLLIETFNDDLPERARPGGGDRWFEVVRTLLTRPDDPFWDDKDTKIVEGKEDILRRSMALAYDELSELQGDKPKKWRWGDLHTLTLAHESFGTSGIGLIESIFNRGPIPAPGNDDAVNAIGWDVQDGYQVTSVPSMRMVVDLADPDRSRWINLTGASGHAFHDNYWDQAALWARGDTTPMLGRQESIEKAAVHTLTLTP